MTERHKIIFIFSTTLFILTALISVGSIAFLYKTSVKEQQERLLDQVLSRAILLENVIGQLNSSDSNPLVEEKEDIAIQRTFSLLRQSIAPPHDTASRKSSLQFILARKDTKNVIFINSTGQKMPVAPLEKISKKPIGLALDGQTGSIQITDHLGVPVIVAYTPITNTEWGLAAKISITDLQTAFIRTGFMVGIAALMLLLFGLFILLKIVDPLIYQMEKSRDEAQAANSIKNIFLANISHEIRTPMNSIITAAGLALDEKPDSQMSYYLATIHYAGENLLLLINDILDFSKIEANKLKLENTPFLLRDTLDRTIQTISLTAQQKKIDLSLQIASDVPSAVSGDSLRLRQILLNLLSNAVKFTERGSIIVRVKKGTERKGQMELCFSVQDSGIGIAPDKIENIFQSFEQGDNSVTRKFGGTGLGLSICRKLCHMMGGEISVESTQGKGSIFEFNVFFTETDGKDISPETIALTKPTGKSLPLDLLLVEDVDLNRELATMSLQRQGHSITGARNGKEALAILADQSFDAILMDVQMPEMDGYTASKIIRACETGQNIDEIHPDLVRKLRTKLEGEHIPIIALTAHAVSGDRDKCFEAGMDDYLTKPFKAFHVTDTLQRHIHHYSANSQSEERKDASVPHQKNITDNDLDAMVIGRLKKRYPFSDEKLEMLLESTKKNLTDNLASLDKAIEHNDCKQIFPIAHAVHGTLLTLEEFAEAVLLVSKIESAARNDESDAPYDEWLTKLQKNLASFI